MTDDLVNHPSHYASVVPGVECIEISEQFRFSRGNAIKYLWRYKDKQNPIEDLKKAIWYIKRDKELAIQYPALQAQRVDYIANKLHAAEDYFGNTNIGQALHILWYPTDPLLDANRAIDCIEREIVELEKQHA